MFFPRNLMRKVMSYRGPPRPVPQWTELRGAAGDATAGPHDGSQGPRTWGKLLRSRKWKAPHSLNKRTVQGSAK